MAHHIIASPEKKPRPRRTDDVYATVIEALTSPMTAHQLAVKINMLNGGIFAVMVRLLNEGAVSRKKKGKCFVYSRKVKTVTKQDMNQFKPTAPKREPTIAGARVIDFGSSQMQSKLHALDKIYQADRKRKAGKVYISGQSLDMIG